MIAQESLISLKPITPENKVIDCIELMKSLLCFELPVIDDGKLFGTISLDACLDSKDETIKELVSPGFASVYVNTHVFDVLRVFSETHLNSAAVLGHEFEFLGIITKNGILDSLSESLSVEQAGAIVIIEMAAHQYSPTEISRIIESEGSKLLGLWIETIPDSGRIRASLKLNTANAERIISGLVRFNYEVIATFGDDDYKENVEKRFDSLMKYLDI